MIKSKRVILGQEIETAVSKTMYFATNFNGQCSITLTDFLTMEAREKGLENGVNVNIPIEMTEENLERLDKINELVYLIAMTATGGEKV